MGQRGLVHILKHRLLRGLAMTGSWIAMTGSRVAMTNWVCSCQPTVEAGLAKHSLCPRVSSSTCLARRACGKATTGGLPLPVNKLQVKHGCASNLPDKTVPSNSIKERLLLCDRNDKKRCAKLHRGTLQRATRHSASDKICCYNLHHKFFMDTIQDEKIL